MKLIIAVWIAMRFLAPDPGDGARVVSYFGERGNAISWWQTFIPRPQASSSGTVIPKAPGQPEEVWTSVIEQPNDVLGWRNGGQALRLWYVTDAGDTVGPSNYVLTAAAVPDTLMNDLCGSWWLDGTPSGWQWSYPNPLKPAVRQVLWIRAPGDTILAASPRWDVPGVGPISHFESMLQAYRDEMCTFGRWAVGGAWRECP